MQITLFTLVSHVLFQWKYKNSAKQMADNFGSIVHDINGTEIGEELCPIMFKATKKLYKIIGKNKAKSLK